MVTTTSTHPLHTNPTTAALWITRETVAILTNIAMLATILAVGNLFLYQPPSLDFLTPTPGQMIIAAVLAAITIAGGIAGRRLNSSIRFRTPGAINNDPDAKYAPPTLIAITISVLCTWMALAAIITLTPAENWVTPGMYLCVGIAITATALAATITTAIKRRISDPETPLQFRLEPTVFGISLIIAGAVLYQTATLPSFGDHIVDAFITLGLLMAIVLAVVEVIRQAAQTANDDGTLAEAATDLLLRKQVAPTIAARQRAHATLKHTALGLLTAFGIATLAAMLIGTPWTAIVPGIACLGGTIIVLIAMKDENTKHTIIRALKGRKATGKPPTI